MGGSQDEHRRDVVPRQPTRKQATALVRKITELTKQLSNAITQKSAFDRHVHILRQNIKDGAMKVLCLDLNYALSQDIEQSLWKSVFYRVIEDSRRKLKVLSDTLAKVDDPQKLSITKEELQQLTSLYCSFLDEATGFYHSLIDMMTSRFRLDQVHGRFLNMYRMLGADSESHPPLFSSSSSQSPSSSPSSGVKDKAVGVCHRSLIFLGDLARYKQLASEEDQKDWMVPASYYNEAVDLIPTNGNPFNQLAVIATYRDEDMDAVYYYFRSIAVRMPFMTAEENLNLIFQKTKRNIDRDTNKVVDIRKKFLRLHSFLFLEEDGTEAFESRLSEFLSDLSKSYVESGDRNRVDFIFKATIINLSSAFFFAVHRNDSPRKSELIHFSFRLLVSMAECFFSCLVSRLHSVPMENVRSLVSEWDFATAKILINWFCINHSAIEAALRNEQQKKPSHDMIDALRTLLPVIYRLGGGQFIWEGHFQRQALREDFELRGFLPLEAFSQRLQFHPFILMSDEWEERIRSIISSGLEFFRSLELCLPAIQASTINPYLGESNANTLSTARLARDITSTSTGPAADPVTFKNRPRSNLSALDPHSDEVIAYNAKPSVIAATAPITNFHGDTPSTSGISDTMPRLSMASASSTVPVAGPMMTASQIWKPSMTTTTSATDLPEILYPFGVPPSETYLSQFPPSECFSPIQPALVSTRDLLPPPTTFPTLVQNISIGSKRHGLLDRQE
jgi:hypothetical protein